MGPPVVRGPGESLPLADDAPAFPVVELRSSTIQGLRHAPSARWQEALLASGLLSEVTPTDDPDDPRAWMLALQGLFTELVSLEDRRDGLRWVDDRLFLYDAPWWMWLALLFQPWLAVEIGKRQADDVDRLITIALVYGIPGLIAGMIGISAIVVIRRRRLERKEELNVLRDRIAAVRADLAQGALRTLERDFVARAGGRVLVCTPSLSRCTPEQAERMMERVEALKRVPPEHWEDLTVDATG